MIAKQAQAKPGYGKTVLSSAIIDDLVRNCHSRLIAGTDDPSVAYFHFDASSRCGGKTTSEALRALAAQLIDTHQSEVSLLDAISLLFDERTSQPTASEDDVESVIRILLQQHPCFLVIDGIDECVDYEELLRRFSDLMAAFDCRTLMLSRPDIEFPWRYRVKSSPDWLIRLNTTENRDDIESFLRLQIDRLADHGLLGHQQPDPGMPAQLAKRSEGMFLWPTVLVRYLHCPALSPDERNHILSNASLLQDMAQLYNHILGTLQNRYERQRQVAVSIFRWTAFSLYNLGPEELQTAIAIQPGTHTDSGRLLSDWPMCIQQLTCSLMEVDSDNVVSFIHLSFKEFLEHHPHCNPYFSLRNPQTVHKFLATSCISYLVRDILEEPLRKPEPREDIDRNCGFQARVQTQLSSADIRRHALKRFPLLKYAALCWATHLGRALPAPSMPSLQSEPRAQYQRRGQPPRVLPLRRALPSPSMHSRDRVQPRYRRHEVSRGTALLPGYASHIRGSVWTSAADFLSRDDVSLSRHRAMPEQAAPFRADFVDEDDALHADNSYPDILSGSSVVGPSPVESLEIWISLLSEMLIRPFLVTAWAEACLTFGHLPDLAPLRLQLQHLRAEQPLHSIEGRELHWASSGVHRLSWALVDLRNKHMVALTSNPSEIWQRYISSASDPQFWAEWDADKREEMSNDKTAITVEAGVDPRTDGLAAGIDSAGTAVMTLL